MEYNAVQVSTVGLNGAISIGGSTYWPDRIGQEATVALFGLFPDMNQLIDASSVTHLDAADPPLLHVHGANDGYVNVSQAQTLADAIVAKGDPARHSVIIDPTCDHSPGCLTPPRVDPFLAQFVGP